MNTSVATDRARFALGNFLGWWLQELREIISGLAGYKRGEPGLFCVDSAGVVQLDRTASGTGVGQKLHQRRIRLQLPADAMMYRMIRLPVAAASDLEQVLEYEFDKYFPLSWQDVYIAIQTEQQSGDDHLVVHIRAVRKNLIDAAVQQINQEHATQVAEIDLQVEPDVTVGLRNFSHTVADNKSDQQKSSLLFPLLVLMLIIAAALIPFWKMNVYIADLEEQTSQLEKKATDAIAIRNKMLAVEEKLNQVVAAKKQSPQFTKIWSAVTEVMNGKGILASIRVNDNKVIIEGKAGSVEKVVRALEAHAYFNKVSIDAPVKRLEQGKYESLRLSFMVKHDG